MRKTLEDLYYGNITPNEQQMTPGSELKRLPLEILLAQAVGGEVASVVGGVLQPLNG